MIRLTSGEGAASGGVITFLQRVVSHGSVRKRKIIVDKAAGYHGNKLGIPTILGCDARLTWDPDP